MAAIFGSAVRSAPRFIAARRNSATFLSADVDSETRYSLIDADGGSLVGILATNGAAPPQLVLVYDFASQSAWPGSQEVLDHLMEAHPRRARPEP